jgi:hypothetical protein
MHGWQNRRRFQQQGLPVQADQQAAVVAHHSEVEASRGADHGPGEPGKSKIRVSQVPDNVKFRSNRR